MSKKLIEKLRTDRDDYVETVNAFATRLEEGEELSEGDTTSLAEARTAAAELNDRIGELQEQETARLQAVMRDAEFDELQSVAAERAVGHAKAEERPKTIGEQWVESTQFNEYKDRRSGSSGVMAVEFNLITSTDTAGKPFAGVTKTADAPMPFRTTPLLDACMPMPVSTHEYFWEEWPNSVAVAGDVAEGATKPEADIQPENKFGQLGKAAHYITVTEEALEDNVLMQARIDNELVDGVRQRGEQKAAEALTTAMLPTAEHETLMKAVRVGVAEVQMLGYGIGSPMSCVLNPLDYAEIDIELLALTLQGARRDSPLWALSIIPARNVPQGTAYVGDIYHAMRKYYRTEPKLKMTDSHAGLFLDNKYVILAEQRLSVHLVRPDAVAKCTVTVVP